MAVARLILIVGFYSTCVLLQSATARYGPTCDGLDSVIANAQSMDCTRNDECDTVDCTVTQQPFDDYSLTLNILPCRDPPGIHVVVRERDSEEIILDNVYDHTVTGINLGSGATLDITVDQLNSSLIGIKAVVNIRFSAFFTLSRDLLEYTTIPLDKASCASPASPTRQETTVTSTPMSTLPEITETPTPYIPQVTPVSTAPYKPQETPVSTAPYGPTCDALDLVADHARFMDCTRNDRCDTVDCTITWRQFAGNHLTLTILPCRAPPGVHVVIKEPISDGTILDEVYDHTVTDIDLSAVATLDITLDQLNSSIGIKVAVEIGVGFLSTKERLLQYTTIPLDTASCISPVAYTTQEIAVTPTPTQTSQKITETQTPTTLLTMTPTTEEVTGSLIPTSLEVTVTLTSVTQETTETSTSTTQGITDTPTTTQQITEIQTTSTQEITETPTSTTQKITNTPTTTQQIQTTSTQEITETPTSTTHEITDIPTTTQQITEIQTTSTQEITETSTPTAQETTETLATTQQIPDIPTTTPQEITGTPTSTTQEITQTPTPTMTSEIPTSTTRETSEILMPTTVETPTPTTQEITETLEPTETPTVSTGTPPAKDKTTCDVLAELAKSSEAFYCVADTKEPCDHLNCTAELLEFKLSAEVVLLPCHSPPAVHITMTVSEKVAVNKTVDHSQEIIIPELLNLNLNITLDHFKDAIGLQVDADVPLVKDPIPILEYTVIPMERYNCDVGDTKSSRNGVQETTAAILTLVSLLSFAAGMM